MMGRTASAPLVTIGMPVINGQRYLVETLESILTQTFEDFELVVSDNASVDATEEIVRDLAHRDRRIRYSRNERNLGAAKNYNRLVDLARGRYFKWAGYDDLLAPTYLSRCVEVLEHAPRSVVLCYPRTTIIDGEGTVVREHADRLDLRSEDPVERLCTFTRNWGLCNPCFGLMRRDVLVGTRLIGSYVSSDVPLLAELALRGEFHEIPDRLFFRRVHAGSSRQGDVTLRQVVQWFDSSQTRPPLLGPRNRVFLEILRVIAESELAPDEKARCVARFSSTWVRRRTRVRAGAVRRRLADRSAASPTPEGRAGGPPELPWLLAPASQDPSTSGG